MPMYASPPGLEIVRASPADVSVIAPLFDAYRQFYKKPSNEEAARRFLFARLSKAESIFFYATHEERAVGFVHLYPLFSSLSLTRQWILSDLYVNSQARNHGVGRALMEHARTFAVETQAERLVLETATDNTIAQKLYETLGWKREQEFCAYFLAVDG